MFFCSKFEFNYFILILQNKNGSVIKEEPFLISAIFIAALALATASGFLSASGYL
jgi:hypothetical protein